jgi:hypothetical protein
MSAVPNVFTRKPKTLGPQKNKELEEIVGGISGGKYTRRGNTRKTNMTRAQKLLKWYENSEAKETKKASGKEFGKDFYDRKAWLTNLTRALAKSRSRSRSRGSGQSKGPSEAEIYEAMPYIFGPNNGPVLTKSKGSKGSKSSKGLPSHSRGSKGSKASRSSKGAAVVKTRKTRAPGGTRKGKAVNTSHPLTPLHKTDIQGRKQLWAIKVEQSSRGAKITKVHGLEGGKTQTSSSEYGSGNTRAGRNPYEEAMKDAVAAWESKKKEGYTSRGKPASIAQLHNNDNSNWKYF